MNKQDEIAFCKTRIEEQCEYIVAALEDKARPEVIASARAVKNNFQLRLDVLENMPELRRTYVIYFIDINPDEGDVSQMKPVAYVDEEDFAKALIKFLNSVDGDGNVDPNRTYYYRHL